MSYCAPVNWQFNVTKRKMKEQWNKTTKKTASSFTSRAFVFVFGFFVWGGEEVEASGFFCSYDWGDKGKVMGLVGWLKRVLWNEKPLGVWRRALWCNLIYLHHTTSARMAGNGDRARHWPKWRERVLSHSSWHHRKVSRRTFNSGSNSPSFSLPTNFPLFFILRLQ